jgi:predicted signal transduction protein with EAL and GGDEF domain
MKKILPILAGIFSAFAVMMTFEFTNSLLFPFPADLDTQSLEQVRAFAAQMPLTALILVALGWMIGSTLGGYLSTKLSKTTSMQPALTVGIVLTLLGAVNAWMIQNPLWFHVGGLTIFIIFSFISYLIFKNISI